MKISLLSKKFMQKPISKKLISLSLIIIIFSGLFLVNIGVVEAAPGVLEDAAKWLIGGLFTVLLYIAQAFTAFVGNIFKGIVHFGFQQMDVVRMGWTITRDIVNMFFILGLIVIAFATILRIETYGIKALLQKLIIIALLINFSYLVCGLIIDATQIAATYFLNQIETEDIAIAVLSRLKVIDAIRGVEGMRVAITDYDPDMVVILTTAFSAIIIFLAGFVMLVGAILLFIRVGALWALIILAPFAWFFSIFPGKLKSYSSQWWDNFLKYAFFAPIYIFFIFLVLKISKAGVLEGMGLVTGETAVGLGNLTLVPMFGDLNMLFRYVFLIILLFGAPTIAMSMGIKGAGAAQSFVKGGLKGTAKLAYKLPGKLRGAMVAPPGWMKAIPVVKQVTAGISTVAKWTTPAFWKQAYEERKKERLREAKTGYTVGKMQDFQTRVLSLFTRKTKHAEEAEQFEVDEESQKIALETNRESSQLLAVLRSAVKGKDKIRASATLKLLFDQNDHNDLQLDKEFSEWKWTDKSDTAREENKVGKTYSIDGRATTDQAGLKDLLFQMYAKMGVSEGKAAPIIGNLSHTALASGNYGAYHMTHTETSGREGRSSDEDQKKIAATKAATVNVRVKTRTEHPTNIIKEGWDTAKKEYTYAGIDQFGLYQLKQLTQTEINERRYGEGRPDYLKLVPEALKDLDKAIKKADEQERKRAEAEGRDAELWTEDEKLKARTFLENTARGTPKKGEKAEKAEKEITKETAFEVIAKEIEEKEKGV